MEWWLSGINDGGLDVAIVMERTTGRLRDVSPTVAQAIGQ